jgi:hypothetical protein
MKAIRKATSPRVPACPAWRAYSPIRPRIRSIAATIKTTCTIIQALDATAALSG